MNQDQVKDALLQLEADTEEFTIILSGKQSRKVNGLYHPETREIIIHNKNFSDDNDLMYTAIHEFAHHLHFTGSPVPISCKAHTNEFWDIFHRLLVKAEDIQVYRNVFDDNEEFKVLTQKIKVDYLAKNGFLMKEFGKLLVEAEGLCKRNNARFEDYVDRVLGVHRTTAKVLMRMHALNVNPSIGFENMKTVTTLKNEEVRKQAEDAFLSGKSPDMVKAQFGRRPKEVEPSERLKQEKVRIEKTIASLQHRLEQIESRLEQMEE